MEKRIVKLQITSDLMGYGPMPDDGEVMLQKITIRDDGRVWYSTRVWDSSCDFDYAPGIRKQFRISLEDAKEILNMAKVIHKEPP